MSAATRTVIVGAGFGGIATARTLRELLPPPHRILVVDWRPEVSLGAGHTWVLTGRRRPEQVSRRLSAITRHGLEFRCAEVVGVDPGKRILEVAGDKVPADALVLAPGARLTLEPLPGAAGVAHQFYELDAALRLGGALDAFAGGRVLLAIIAPIARRPTAALPSRAPAKAGSSGSTITPSRSRARSPGRRGWRRRGSTSSAGSPHAGAAGARPSPSSTPLGPVARDAAVRASDGEKMPFDLLIVIPAHVTPAFLRDSGLLGGNGWIGVQRETLGTAFDGVYAIGDVTHVPLAGGGMLPKAGVLARAEGEAVARAIAAKVLGSAGGNGGPASFDGKGGCYLETGRGEAAFAEGDFFADPAPVVTLQAPSRAGLAGKEKFAKEWARWY